MDSFADKYPIFKDLEGVTLTAIEIENGDDEHRITFRTADKAWKLYHEQECCELVTIEDINGDIQSLVGTPILKAEEVTDESIDSAYGSTTYTFYHLHTLKDVVTIRWHGTSNGYYSESVSFDRC